MKHLIVLETTKSHGATNSKEELAGLNERFLKEGYAIPLSEFIEKFNKGDYDDFQIFLKEEEVDDMTDQEFLDYIRKKAEAMVKEDFNYVHKGLVEHNTFDDIGAYAREPKIAVIESYLKEIDDKDDEEKGICNDYGYDYKIFKELMKNPRGQYEPLTSTRFKQNIDKVQEMIDDIFDCDVFKEWYEENESDFNDYRDIIWNTMFEYRYGISDTRMLIAEHCGIAIVEDANNEYFDTLFGFTGCGYDFYEAHWIPLYILTDATQKERERYFKIREKE